MENCNEKNQNSSHQNLSNIKRQQRSTMQMVASIYEPPVQTYQNSLNSRIKPIQNLKIESYVQYTNKLVENQYPQASNANINFIWSLLPENKPKQILSFQEGDYINLNLQDKWLLIQGTIKITGINGHCYTMTEGYLFFISIETKKKVKEIIAVKSCKFLKIAQYLFKNYLRNYVFLKNAEKIKYLKYCPFVIWNGHMSEDLAVCMEMESYERQETIYSAEDSAQYIYFVKQGIVLLQRIQPLINKIIKDYQQHYEKNEMSESQTVLIVKKGMIFGMDGLLIRQKRNIQMKNRIQIAIKIKQNKSQKQKDQNKNQQQNLIQNNNSKNNNNNNIQKQKIIQIKNNNQQNPQTNDFQINRNNNNNYHNNRIYTARTIGRCQIYKLKKQILFTLCNLFDLRNTNRFFPQPVTSQLQRICQEYTSNLIFENINNNNISNNIMNNSKAMTRLQVARPMCTKDFQLRQIAEQQSLQQKRNNVRHIKQREQRVKRLSIGNKIADTKPRKISKEILNRIPILYNQDNPFNHYSNKNILNTKKKSVINLPVLNKRQLQDISRNQKSGKQYHKESWQYLHYKMYIEQQIIKNSQKNQIIQKSNIKNQLINVKSYRNLMIQ